jgi:hypothetical protein
MLVLAAVLPCSAAAGTEFYGINSGSGVLALPADQRDTVLAQMRADGISVVRIDASWSGIEPSAPSADGVRTYRWARYDEMAGAMARQGLRWYPMLGYSTSWSGTVAGDLFSGPADPAAYGDFVRAFAQRYGRGGTFWSAHPELPNLPTVSYEIWNEPDAEQFWHQQDTAPDEYADLYLSARAAVHAVDPQAEAVVGGLIDMNAARFLRRMFVHRPDLPSRIDALGFHPYQQFNGVLGGIREMRDTLDQAGANGVPIEITEIGWFKGSRSEASRARLLGSLARTLRRSTLNVTRFIPYVWMGGDYALWNQDGSPMPAGQAYVDAIRTVTGPQHQTLGSAAVEHLRNGRPSAARRGR